MESDDELLDLVDQNDQVIGTILRSQKPGLGRHGFLRAAELFIQNSHGELWVPRRSPHKSIAPGGFDFSASGHVGSGESYLEALKREVKEELNLNLDPQSLKLIYKFPPTGDEKLFFRAVYIYYSDEVPKFNRGDFSGYEWLAPKELLKRLVAGERAKRSLQETVTYLLKHPE